MIQLIPQLRILLACKPIDFRNGIDGLAALCKRELAEDPFSGALYVFRNRRGTALKMLCYDGVGFWLVTRRLSQGRIRWWPEDQDAMLQPFEAQQLSVLLTMVCPIRPASRQPGGSCPALKLKPPMIPFPFSCNSTANTDPDYFARPFCCE